MEKMSEGKVREFLKLSREQLSGSMDASRDNRERGLDDLRCLTGSALWDDQVKAQRVSENRPCITINQLPQFLRQVTGDLRAMDPAVNITPADSAATDDVAEILEGLIRQIQYQNDASSVYERAGESAAACGEGYFRILTDYEDAMSFAQEIKIETIYNPHSVHFDPSARMPTRQDAKWVYITEALTGDEFKAAYPKATPASVESPGEIDSAANWMRGDHVIIAEKFWIETKKVKIGLMPDGSVMENPPDGMATDTRETDKAVVMWAKMSANEVLEGPREFPSQFLPIIAVVGEELAIGENTYQSSVIRFAKEPARLYCYYTSADAEIVALQPKSPFMMTPKQVAGHDDRFANANVKSYAYLLYNPDPAAPAPARVQPPVSSQGLAEGIARASADMRSTTGIYDASLGHKGNETSGVAIRQRQMEADVSTSIYSDNVGKAVAHCGRVLVDMIPRVYDTTRVLRIVGKDESQNKVQVNQPIMEDGILAIRNDLTVGRYDVRVSVGPNYTTKRQEAAEKMLEISRAAPQIWGFAGDLLVKALDLPGADQLAERFIQAMPPELRPKSDEPPDPQEMMAQQQGQQVQAMQQQMMQAMAQAKLEQEQAQAAKAASDAERAKYEVMQAELDLRMQANAAHVAHVGQAPAIGGSFPPQLGPMA